MFTEEGLENIKHNLESASEYILTSEAHDAWKPIILELLKRVLVTYKRGED